MKIINSIFEEKAAQMGHDIEALNAGHEVSSVIDISDIDSFKALLQDGRRITEQKDEEARMAFGELSTANNKAALQQRVNHFIYGNYELTSSEKEAANATFFPMKVLAISAKNKTIDQPTTLGSTALPTLINYGTLHLKDNGPIIVAEGVELIFTTANLIRTGSAPATMGDINILGRRGIDGVSGGTGPQGAMGPPGGTGGTGGRGGYGGYATDGMPSRQAIISITESIQSSSPIVVYTASGAGGTGGSGGKGGRGGNGGAGGNGGDGGRGGTGGKGGKSVDAQGNVMIYVAAAYINDITGKSDIVAAGAGGESGPGGDPGTGVNNGQKGTNGDPGAAGDTPGKPADIIIRPY